MKRLITLRRWLALLLVLGFGAPQARAQAVAIGFGKHGHHGSLSISAGFLLGGSTYRAPVRCAPQPIWIPGHFQDVERRVFVPGCSRQVFVPAVFGDRVWRDYCGRVHVERVQTCPATWRIVQDPGHWQCVTERIWIEGSWSKVAN